MRPFQKSGTVYVDRIANVRDTVINCDIDEVWAIVRSYKSPIVAPNNVPVIHVPELSPSRELFHMYLDLKKQGQWGFETFSRMYVPQFLQEMLGESARNRLTQIVNRTLQEKKNILLVCYCEEELLCHRSIIKGLLQGRGIPCKTHASPVNFDYSQYFKVYLEMWKRI